jgi:hypothetical protein
MVALKIALGMKEVRDMQQELSGEGQEGPDPLIKLKETELQQRAQNDQAKNQIDQQRLALDQQKLQDTKMFNQQKLALQEAKVNQPPMGVQNAA